MNKAGVDCATAKQLESENMKIRNLRRAWLPEGNGHYMKQILLSLTLSVLLVQNAGAYAPTPCIMAAQMQGSEVGFWCTYNAVCSAANQSVSAAGLQAGVDWSVWDFKVATLDLCAGLDDDDCFLSISLGPLSFGVGC